MDSERILNNWNKLIELIENTFSDNRKEKLLKMYEYFKDRMMFAPASGQQHFHLCEPGGYVEHVLNIVKYSKAFYQIWKDNDAYVEDYTEEEFDSVINLNLKATFNTIQLASNKMSNQKNGSIIAFSSIRGTVVEPGQSVYAATKAGTEKLVNTLASEVGKFNVRVNTISPGPVMTPLTNQLREDADWNNAYKTKPALNRWAEPHELTGGILYLLSDASTYVTGSNLRIDGGWTAHDGRFNPEI